MQVTNGDFKDRLRAELQLATAHAERIAPIEVAFFGNHLQPIATVAKSKRDCPKEKPRNPCGKDDSNAVNQRLPRPHLM
jgi:hypothetical protein